MLDELYTKVNTTSEAVIIPERYASLVKDTADSLSAGMVCYINPASLEKIDIPQSIIGTMMFDEEGEEENKDVKKDLFYAFLKRINRDWKETITINLPQSHESFSFRERFVNTLQESRLSKMLLRIKRILPCLEIWNEEEDYDRTTDLKEGELPF